MTAPSAKIPATAVHHLPPVVMETLIDKGALPPHIIYGTELDDHIIGTATAYTQEIHGLGGNDVLELPLLGRTAYGDGGDDTLIGGGSGSSNSLGGGIGDAA